jgi:hypothetical protein
MAIKPALPASRRRRRISQSAMSRIVPEKQPIETEARLPSNEGKGTFIVLLFSVLEDHTKTI